MLREAGIDFYEDEPQGSVLDEVIPVSYNWFYATKKETGKRIVWLFRREDIYKLLNEWNKLSSLWKYWTEE